MSRRTIHALKSWAAALNETPGEQYVHYTELWTGNHFGFRATAAFGDWTVGLESEELRFGLCAFIYIFLPSDPRFLKGNSTLRCCHTAIRRQNLWRVFREVFCDKDNTVTLPQPASRSSTSIAHFLIFQVEFWLHWAYSAGNCCEPVADYMCGWRVC